MFTYFENAIKYEGLWCFLLTDKIPEEYTDCLCPQHEYNTHPSLLYLLALSENGAVYIFNIADGVIRGRIQVGKGCKQIITDSSGLYFAVLTPIKTVQMFEVGTGRKVYEFCPQLKQIGECIFSASIYWKRAQISCVFK